jgi:hypothetical protein
MFTSLWFAGHNTGLSTDSLTITGGGLETVTMLVDELLLESLSGVRGSAELIVVVLTMTVSLGVGQFTFTTILNCAVSLAAIEAFVNLMTPVPPGTGAIATLQPSGAEADTNVVFAGVLSITVTEFELLGPLFTAFIV